MVGMPQLEYVTKGLRKKIAGRQKTNTFPYYLPNLAPAEDGMGVDVMLE